MTAQDLEAARNSFLNLVEYTPLEFVLFAGGCLMWVVAYAILVRNGYRNKFIEMPPIAAASNFAWEFLWSTAFETDMGLLLVWTYRAWIIFDLAIFAMVIIYGSRLVLTPALKSHFRPLIVAVMLCFLALYYLFTSEGFDTSIGAHSAYIAQLFISGFYIVVILQQRDLRLFSASIAWLRSVGTGMNTVFMLIHYPQHHWLHAMGLIALLLDTCYIIMFYRLRASTSAAAARVDAASARTEIQTAGGA